MEGPILVAALTPTIGKRPSSAKDDEGDDEDRPAKTVKEDYEAIDSSNIIPRGKRRAALASGLARAAPPSRPVSSGGKLSRPKHNDDTDDEAEF